MYTALAALSSAKVNGVHKGRCLSLSEPGCGRKDLREKMSPRETNSYKLSSPPLIFYTSYE